MSRRILHTHGSEPSLPHHRGALEPAIPRDMEHRLSHRLRRGRRPSSRNPFYDPGRSVVCFTFRIFRDHAAALRETVEGGEDLGVSHATESGENVVGHNLGVGYGLILPVPYQELFVVWPPQSTWVVDSLLFHHLRRTRPPRNCTTANVLITYCLP